MADPALRSLPLSEGGLLTPLLLFSASAFASETEGTVMDPGSVPLVLGLMLALLVASGFFAMSESALFSLQKVDREALRDDARVGDLITSLLHRPRRLLAALLIGNEVSNIALSAASASVLMTLAPTLPWLNVVVAAPLLILFGDVFPKTFGLRFARPVASTIARPLAFWNEVISPVRFVLAGTVDGLLRLVGVQPPDDAETLREEQLRTLIDQGMETGVIQPMEQEIIHRVFEFGELPVSRLMTPRPDIFSYSITTPWAELVAAMREARYSRVPLWQGNADNVVGILLAKDLLKLRGGPPPNARQLQRMLHPALFVPPSKQAKDLLREFRGRMAHLALVVDEHGSVVGLITLDDLLTELVGEVFDESDAEEAEVTQLQPSQWMVRGGMDIDDFATAFDIEPPEGDWTTLGGFVFHLLGRAPQKGDEVGWNNLTFHVSGVEGRRITEVTLSREDADADATEEGGA